MQFFCERASLKLDELGGGVHGPEHGRGGGGKLAESHGDLVAVLAARAADAVFRVLVGNRRERDRVEAVVGEKGRDAREKAGAAGAGGLDVVEQLLEQQPARAAAAGLRPDGDGADFSQVRAVAVKRGAAEEFARAGLGDDKGVDLSFDFAPGAAQQGAIAGHALDEVEDVG